MNTMQRYNYFCNSKASGTEKFEKLRKKSYLYSQIQESNMPFTYKYPGLVITILFTLVTLAGQAQDVSEAFRPLMNRLTAFGKTIPQEKVYVHMDNTCYFQGDTIWFTAYTRQTNTDTPSNMSGVLYVELLNNDGYLVERKLIEMKGGRGSGFFDLNNLIQYSGFYELRAYTRWQLNWGEHERRHPQYFSFMFRDKASERDYFRDYDKLYSRVFPVYDKPLTLGDYTRNMTLRVLRREFKDDPDKRKLQLSLFPEGGNLIAGVENRVAFEAAMTDGERMEGTLSVGTKQAKTVNRGRGTFTFIPEKGIEQEVTFVASNGKKVSAKLPKPEEKGAAIKVVQAGDNIIIEANLAGLEADSLALTIMHEGKVEEFLEFKSKFIIQKSKLKAGIHQATIFDTQGHVYADRLFFVTTPELSQPTLTVSGMKDEYVPYEKVELKVAGNSKSAPISLAVRDRYQSDPIFDDGNIMVEMLLSSEIRGFIPNPGWYFEKDDEEHRQALDLLMMTQGWRRFVWRDMAVPGEWDLTQPNEKYPLLVGKVSFNPHRISYNGIKDLKDNRGIIPLRDYKYALELARKNLTPTLRIHSEMVHLDTKETAVSEDPYTGNYFKMPCPKFYGNCVYFLSVADTAKWEKDKKEYTWIQMAGQGEEYPLHIMRKLDLDEADYRAYISWPYPRFVKPYTFYQTHLPLNSATSGYDIPSELLADSTKALREVTITARRKSRLKGFNAAYPAFMVDAYDAWNAIEDAGVPIFDYKDIRKALVRVYLNDYGVDEEKDGNGNDRIGFSFPRQSLAEYINVPIDSLEQPRNMKSVVSNVTSGEVGDVTLGEVGDISSGGSSDISTGEPGNDPSLREVNDIHAGDGSDFPAESSNVSPGELRNYFGDERIGEDPRFKVEKYVVYTDYQPRLDGSKRYMGANRPETTIAIYPFPDGSQRVVYRDRRYILEGFAYPAEFYKPDYSQQTPPEPTDYRRTLYWNPDITLDENGEANITFYNNSRQTTLSIEAEGQAADGTLLWSE